MMTMKGYLILMLSVMAAVVVASLAVAHYGPRADTADEVPEIIQLTDTAWYEQNTALENYRVYHIRYSAERTDAVVSAGNRIIELEGVAHTGFSPYKIEVKKSPVYTWDEIQPKIKELIIEFEKAEVESEEVEGDI